MGTFWLRALSTGVVVTAMLAPAAFVASTAVAATPIHTVTKQESEAVSRQSGADRFATSAMISREAFSPGVKVAYVANGANFPDALSGAAVAGAKGGPVLLLPVSGIPGVIAAELTRLKPETIVVLGGTSVISDASKTALQTFSTSTAEGAVSRQAGADRFATSAMISREAFSPGVKVAYVANGENFPDALSGAAVAGAKGAPVLLLPASGIPEVIATELTRLRPETIVILGGTSVVSDASTAALQAFATSTAEGAVSRQAGADRFATSAMISREAFSPGVKVAYVANGANFPDALSGAAVAGTKSGPVLLLPANGIPEAIAAELTRLKPESIVVLGGSGVISYATQTALYAFATNSGSDSSVLDHFAATFNGQSNIPNVWGTYPGQCVSLVSQFLQQMFGITAGGWGNAVDYQAGSEGGNQLQARGFTWHTDQNFQNGDLLVWGEAPRSSVYGHVGIWHNGQVFDQNNAVNGRTYQPVTGTWSVGYVDFFSSGFLGYWRHS